MHWNKFKRVAAGAAMVAAALAAGSAQATAFTITLDVSGVLSNDGLGAAANEVYVFDTGMSARVVGVSYDVTLLADAPSFLSEMSIDVNGGMLTVMPGALAAGSGPESFSESFDLQALGLDFGLGNTGRLSLEFFESFDDFVGTDGQWLRGTVSFQLIPAPATAGLAALALLGLGATGRRKTQQA